MPAAAVVVALLEPPELLLDLFEGSSEHLLHIRLMQYGIVSRVCSWTCPRETLHGGIWTGS